MVRLYEIVTKDNGTTHRILAASRDTREEISELMEDGHTYEIEEDAIEN